MMNLFRSKASFEEARNYMPGGVNSPVRSYPHMDCPPPFIASAKGSHITDIDGNTYIDYVGSWGPMILGHAHPPSNFRDSKSGGKQYKLRRTDGDRNRTGQTGYCFLPVH